MNPKLFLSLFLFLAFVGSCTLGEKFNGVSGNESKYLEMSRDLEEKPQTEWPEPINKLVKDMVALRGGEYEMGCIGEWYDKCSTAELPKHEVRLGGFSIGKYEVTQAQWKSIMEPVEEGSDNNLNEVSVQDTRQENYPVNTVSWDEVQVFISRLNGLTGKHFRLPTEAEWEYAARGNERYRFAGHEYIDSVAWFEGNSEDEIHAVGQKVPNAYGLYDMSGNVWEWCSDLFSFSYYEKSPKENPKGAKSGSYRSVRGGSYDYPVNSCTVTSRGSSLQTKRDESVGFRLVEPDEPESSSWPGPVRDLVKDMVRVEGGTFQMGCTSEQLDECQSWEYPVHEVQVETFQMGKHEVSQAQWVAIMGDNPSKFVGCEHCPVEGVSWQDVQVFIQRLNDLTRQSFRLPTEPEWEYAARGMRSTKYAGSNYIDSVGWYSANSEGQTHPVGQKNANGYDLFDMTGNVSEWCREVYYSYDQEDFNEAEHEETTSHMIRGGSWFVPARHNRLTDRGSRKAKAKDATIGFRVAL